MAENGRGAGPCAGPTPCAGARAGARADKPGGVEGQENVVGRDLLVRTRPSFVTTEHAACVYGVSELAT